MRSGEGLSVRRRQLLYRCWRRGTREMDLLMGRFADSCIAALDDAELTLLEQLAAEPDPDIFAWVLGEEAVPPGHDTAIFRRLRAFNQGRADPI